MIHLENIFLLYKQENYLPPILVRGVQGITFSGIMFFTESLKTRRNRQMNKPCRFEIYTIARENSISSAMAKLLGPGGRYLNWSPSNTRKRAGEHFDKGEPFSTAISAGGAV